MFLDMPSSKMFYQVKIFVNKSLKVRWVSSYLNNVFISFLHIHAWNVDVSSDMHVWSWTWHLKYADLTLRSCLLKTKNLPWCFCKRKKFGNITLSVKDWSWNMMGCKSFRRYDAEYMELSLQWQELESCEAV